MRQKLGEMLIEAGAIDQAQLKAALADQRRWGRPLGKTLVELRLIREEDLVRILAKQLGLPGVDLDKLEIPKHVIELVPGHVARQYQVIPIGLQMKFLDIATTDPTNLGVIDEIRIRTQLNPRAVLAGPKMIERAIEKYYGASTRISMEIAIPIQQEVEKPTERETVSVTSTEMRDGLRTYRATTTAPQMRYDDDDLATAAARRPRDKTMPPPPVSLPVRDEEIDALQERISNLEALVARDEQVLRKLLSLLIEKGIATREEILERLG